MAYKIAVASSDGINVDETFGSALSFIIYEVNEGNISKLEIRHANAENLIENVSTVSESGCDASKNNCQSGCGNGSGCSGGGCLSDASFKVELVSDCRAIVCKKIGFHIQKQLERKAISSFDVSVTIEEALKKITFYYNRIDKHESLRK